MRDQPLAAYGRGDDKGGGLALEMTLWSRDTVLCTDGPSQLSTDYRSRLERRGVAVREEKIIRLEIISSSIPYHASFDIVFEAGPRLHRAAIFFNTDTHPSTDLAVGLGCDLYDPKGGKVDDDQMTPLPGLYVAGDASRDVMQVIVGAAEGAQAAIGINTALFREDLTL